MFKILLELLSPSERIQGFFLVLWVLIVALMDVAGIASIMPFIAVLTNPELIQTNEYLAMLYDFSGYSDAQEFLFLLGVIVFSLLVISLSLKALTTALMVFSTAFGTALFGFLIDGGFSIEHIASLSFIYVAISTILLFVVRNKLNPQNL